MYTRCVIRHNYFTSRKLLADVFIEWNLVFETVAQTVDYNNSHLPLAMTTVSPEDRVHNLEFTENDHHSYYL